MAISALSPQTSPLLFPLPAEEDPIDEIAYSVFQSPSFWAVSAVIGTLLLGSLSCIVLSPWMILPITFCAMNAIGIAYCFADDDMRKWLICELSLIFTTLCDLFPCSNRPWSSEITPEITLGANPMRERGYFESITQNYGAVLSFLEDFEEEPHLCGTPVRFSEWQNVGLEVLKLPTKDRYPVSVADVERAVLFIEEQIEKGHRIYVHCNAGAGRSATAVISYFIKKEGLSVEEAIAFVAERRFISVHYSKQALSQYVGACAKLAI